jgi:DNA processing protein
VSDQERLLRVALNELIEPGDPRAARLVRDLGVDGLYRALSSGPVVGEAEDSRRDAAARLASLDPARTLESAEKSGLRFVIPGDAEWPAQLDDLAGVEEVQDRGGIPLGLWVRGALRLDELAMSLAVVGTRDATSYGAECATEIAATAARAGLPVVSGGAFGIDAAAHEGALAMRGTTVAVLACGADRAYPQEHAPLLEAIAARGAVVSEVGPGRPVMRLRFLARNRLIAALTAGTVVVEAAFRSGSLNTANWAERLSRRTMGVPGPTSSAQSQGVHDLLRRGAAIVTRGVEALEILGVAGEHLVEERRAPAKRRDRLSSRDQQILDAVPVVHPAGADSIARTAGVAILLVERALERLELGGLVEHLPGGWRLTVDAVHG